MCKGCYATLGASPSSLGERELRPVVPPCSCPCDRDMMSPTGDHIWYECAGCPTHILRVPPRVSDGAEFPGQ